MASAAPGWFGKISCLGDFAQRRLPSEWVRACDDWLSRCVAHSQAQLGSQWLPVYLAAPVWRFVWGPGVADANWWFGLLMPSCDSVGRYFPLVLAQPRPEPPDDRFAMAHLDLWWQHLEHSALATLSDSASVETFETALGEAPAWPAPAASSPRARAQAHPPAWAMPAGGVTADLAHAMATAALRERLQGQSLWWPWRGPAQASECVLTPGLPSPTLFGELLQAA